MLATWRFGRTKKLPFERDVEHILRGNNIAKCHNKEAYDGRIGGRWHRSSDAQR